LEGESIDYYPSVAEKKQVLLLFDITGGYDRRYFDLITDVHLTDYVDQIANRLNQQLSIEQVLQQKVKGLLDFCSVDEVEGKISLFRWITYSMDQC
jgi:hypothetical protein